VLDKCSRSVYLCVCPVQFALYVKLRTVMTAAHVHSDLTLFRYIDDCNKHMHACLCDKKVNTGCMTLVQADFISRQKSTAL